MKVIKNYQKTDCEKCQYHGGIASSSKTAPLYCDYIGWTNRRRPCKPGECREKGIWKPYVLTRKPEQILRLYGDD